MKYYVGLDVGGTYIKSAVVKSNGEVIDDKIFIDEALANKDKETVIANIINIIDTRIKSLNHCLFSGVGIAFPGPFDYESGISYIRGINKYESIYGVNIKDIIINYVKDNLNNITEDFDVKFENDAAMFALGEEVLNKNKVDNVFALSIGTGTGSAYIENHELIKSKCIYGIPYKESIVDDYISSRGILKIAKENGVSESDIKILSEKAMEEEVSGISNSKCKYKKVWHEFEKNVMEVLMLATDKFYVNRIIIGGQISKSHKLFLKTSIKYFHSKNIDIVISNDTSKSAIVGSTTLFSN